jgi:hypothetical protein
VSGGPRKRRRHVILALRQVLGMSLWFSASAVLSPLQTEHAIGGAEAAALSSSVAFGFVAGTLLNAVLGLGRKLAQPVWPGLHLRAKRMRQCRNAPGLYIKEHIGR